MAVVPEFIDIAAINDIREVTPESCGVKKVNGRAYDNRTKIGRVCRVR
jgi:hypothetical protein